MMEELNAQLVPQSGQPGQGQIEVVNIASLQRAEVEMAISTARRYPRDLQKFQNTIMSMATVDESTAEQCFYVIPRGKDGTIEGPSVRLAEIALTAYGNINVESMITGQDDKFVYATGCCRDLENNVATRESVRRSIVNRQGQLFSPDMILVTGQAAVSIAWRNAVYRVIPRAYITPVFLRCRKIVSGDVSTLANRRTEVLKRLQSLGISAERVLLCLGHNVIEEITVDDVGTLIGLGSAIKSDQVDIDEAFPAPSTYKTPEPLPKKALDEKPKRKRGRPRKGQEPAALAQPQEGNEGREQPQEGNESRAQPQEDGNTPGPTEGNEDLGEETPDRPAEENSDQETPNAPWG